MYGAIPKNGQRFSKAPANMACLDVYRFNRRAILLVSLICILLFVLSQHVTTIQPPVGMWKFPMRNRVELQYLISQTREGGEKHPLSGRKKRIQDRLAPVETSQGILKDKDQQREKSFYEIASGYNLTRAQYHDMYERRFRPIITAYKSDSASRRQPFSLLQLGLDCSSAFDPRTSYDAWVEFLPPGTMISFIEPDRSCAEYFLNSVKSGVMSPWREVRELSKNSQWEDPALLKDLGQPADKQSDIGTRDSHRRKARRKDLARSALKQKRKQARRWKISTIPPAAGRRDKSSWKPFGQNATNSPGKVTVYIGDQSDVSFLKNVIFDVSEHRFDVVVDSGTNTIDSQLVAFKGIFPHILRDGGTYFIEHTEHSYNSIFGGEDWQQLKVDQTTVGLMKDLVEEMNTRGSQLRSTRQHNIGKDVAGIECLDQGICALTKKMPDTSPALTVPTPLDSQNYLK